MPMSTWEEVAGHVCAICGGPATHAYGEIYLCCECHAGKDSAFYSREDAAREHNRILSQRKEL